MRKLPVPWANSAEAILYITLLLLLVGTVNVFSASFVSAGQLWGDPFYFLKRHLISVGLGLLGLIVTIKMNYHLLQRWSVRLTCLVIVLLALIYVMGIEANGARRWLKIGIIFQPSELAKMAAIIVTAAYLGPRMERRRKISIFSEPFVLTGIMATLVMRQPDMGTAALIVALCLVLYLLAGLPKKEIMGMVAVVIFAISYFATSAAYRAERISAWLNPWDYQLTTGYQTVQSLLAIGSGGFMGTGLGKGASKFYYLPEAHTDFAFAVLCQELGFVGALFVLILLAGLAWHGMRIALRAPDGFGVLLAGGMTVLIIGQAIGNIAMVSGMIPVTGVPLPFISYGGTSLLVNMAAVGFLVNVGRQSRNAVPETAATPRETLPRQRRLRVLSPNQFKKQ
ncbi:MAG: cell cycle protein [Firmicutes bacterium]|nr:cell cycle protein [Bacillota bacterium]